MTSLTGWLVAGLFAWCWLTMIAIHGVPKRSPAHPIAYWCVVCAFWTNVGVLIAAWWFR